MGKVNLKYCLRCVSHVIFEITWENQNIQLNSYKLKSENYTPDEEAKRTSREETQRFRRKTFPYNSKSFSFLLAMITWAKCFTPTALFSFL